MIDGAADLVDLSELIVRAIDPNWAPPGAKLYMETSNAAAVRVFGCRTQACQEVLLGPGLSNGVQIPIEEADRIFGLEGVQDDASLLLILALKDAEGTVICRDTLRVSVVRVEATWKTLAGDEITEPNIRPGYPGADIGVKYYPDAAEPQGAWNHNVRMEAKTYPPIANFIVYFREIDVDDPAEDANEVDDDGELRGADNAVDFGLGIWDTLTSTDNSGHAAYDFTVDHRPGDNHRVGATLKLSAREFLSVYNVPPSGQPQGQKNDGQLPLFIGHISSLLTVWRNLHVELDSMAAGRDGGVVGNISNAGMETTPSHPTHTWAMMPAFDPTSQAGQFEGGTVTIVPLQPFDVVDNIWSSVYVNGDTTGQIGQNASVLDDDEPFTPQKADISLLTEKLLQAYITVAEAPERATLNIPFEANPDIILPADIYSISAPGRDSPYSFGTNPKYWTAQIMTCNQGGWGADFDPDGLYHWWSGTGGKPGDSALFGVTPNVFWPGYYDNISLIFEETQRDYGEWTHEPYSTHPPIDPNLIRRITVAHEVGHIFGCPHRNGGIMKGEGAWDPDPEYVRDDIRIIRKEPYIEIP